MRRIYATLLLGLTALTVCAQLPFIQQGKNWHVIGFYPRSYLSFEHLTAPEYEIDYSFSENSDTLIGGVKYNRLVGISENKVYDEKCIRENEGKVFFYNLQNKREELLYDFTLQVRDTFTLYPSTLREMHCEVTSVGDSLFCGKQRKVICFKAFRKHEPFDTGTPNMWIEGVGYPRGPIADANSNQDVGGSQQLTLFVTEEIMENIDGETEKPRYTVFASDFNTLYYYGRYYAVGKEKDIDWDDPAILDDESFWEKYQKDDLHYEIVDNSLHLYGYIYGYCCPEYLYLTVDKNQEVRFYMTPLTDILPECAEQHEINMYFPGFYEEGPYTIVDRSGEHHTVEESWLPDNFVNIWQEGSIWEVHYEPDQDAESPETKVIYSLQKADKNYLALEKTLVENNMPGTPELIGYIRTDGDTLIYVRPVLEDGSIGAESVLYDFSTPFEYGNTIRYGVEGGEMKEEYIDWQKDSLDYYILSGDSHVLPAWGGIIYGYGYIGGPMELFQRRCVPGKTTKPKATNISHVIFSTKSGQKAVRRASPESQDEIIIPYKGMLTDGTKWECMAVSKESSEAERTYTIELRGDTLIGNRTCKQVYSPDGNVHKTVFEEGRKLYMVNADNVPEVVLDFGMKKGDALDEVAYVLDVITTQNQGYSYRTSTIETGLECNSYLAVDTEPWLYTLIEGVGVSKDEHLGAHRLLGDDSISYLLRCWKDGVLVYQVPFYEMVTGIRHITTESSTAMYDLQGRRLKNRLQKGVVIIDGKKIIGR